jgi:hypothetical protein
MRANVGRFGKAMRVAQSRLRRREAGSIVWNPRCGGGGDGYRQSGVNARTAQSILRVRQTQLVEQRREAMSATMMISFVGDELERSARSGGGAVVAAGPNLNV